MDKNVNNDSELLIEKLFNKTEILFKFLFIGDFGVGKTSIIRRYAQGTFSPMYKITIGADFALKTINWNENTCINLQLWDIAGHERFGSLTSVYYRYAVAAAIVFDLTRPKTFCSLEKWLTDIREKCSLPCGAKIPVILLANKGDMCFPPILNEIDGFCEKHGIVARFVTSAKENINIDEAMKVLLEIAYRNYYNSPRRSKSIQLNKNDVEVLPKRTCC